jgi:hypothetical protein
MTEDDKKVPKSSEEFYCECCDYYTSRKSQIDRHVLTAKHKKSYAELHLDDANSANLAKKVPHFICSCGKKYKYRQGLWKHKLSCLNNINNINNIDNINNNSLVCKTSNNDIPQEKIDKEMILAIINQNTQLQQQIIDLCKNGVQNDNSIHNINNISNKSFNLNVFLNEKCKNAMNIMDFANSIELNFTDLENIGELGYVEGISKIIIDNLKLLDVTERPIHCSDFKRDVLYVKDKDKWEKENINNDKIKKVINCVTNKNISLIPKWKAANPDCVFSDSIKSTKINKMIMEVMETDKSKYDKIIKNIAKQVTINKK